MHKCFNKLYTYIESVYNSKYNPVSKVKVPKDKNKVIEMNYWTFLEFKQFISVIDDVEHKTLFRVFFMGGFRRGEVLAFKWKHFSKKTLRVESTCSSVAGGWEITSPKTENSKRIVKMDDITSSMLKDLYSIKSKEDGFSDEAFIFGSVNRPLAFETLRNTKNYYEEISKVKHIRIHDLRHSHATLLVEQGKFYQSSSTAPWRYRKCCIKYVYTRNTRKYQRIR